MHINLDSYRVFYYVAQYRSFTKAAEMLYSNQPNVTGQSRIWNKPWTARFLAAPAAVTN